MMMKCATSQIDGFRESTTLAIGLCLVLAGAVRASSGPELPCIGCPEFLSSPVPQTGIWFNPHESGTGFMLQVQSRMVAGYYYLYNEDGTPIWFLLVGQLERSEDPEISWTLSAQLERLEGGSCLDCPYQAPTAVEPAGEIHFEFMQRNFARFQINGGPAQNIWTLTFGLDVTPHFAPTTDYPVPMLDGYWSMSVTDEEGMIYSRGMDLVEVQSDSGDGFTVWLRELARSPSIPTPSPPAKIGELHCSESDNVQGPICQVELDDFPDDNFFMPLGNIGASSFHAESDSTYILHAHKIDFD